MRLFICICFFSLVIVHASSYSIFAQSSYLQSGYTSLVIKLSGDYPIPLDLSTPHVSNPLSIDKPSKFQPVNDTTLMLSFYTFGPSPITFNLNNRYWTSVLLPNQTDVLHIHYVDSLNYTMSYQGHFKEIFDHSNLMPDVIQNYFKNYWEKSTEKKGTAGIFTEANRFRDARLKYMKDMIGQLTDTISSPLLKKYYSTILESLFKSSLIDRYDFDMKGHNKSIGLDSSDVFVHVPVRDISYYDDIVDQKYSDTTSLITSAYNILLNSILKDTVLHIPSIDDGGLHNYRNRLKKLFGHILVDEHNLFYDMMIANAYATLINEGNLLSNKDKFEINEYFDNKHFVNYILYQNEIKNKEKNNMPSKGNYYLPFDKNQDDILSSLLFRYKGKVIVMDFWATWCGPCLQAFDKSRKIRTQYSDNKEIVFVYLTDETSNYGKWNEYVDLLGGEHYYLYENQSDYLYEKYSIKYIPSYLIFDKAGNLMEKSIGKYMGNDKTVEWIEKALTGNP